ncbi:DUF222 domain-containing protein [Actinopolymorpha pittospori]
MDIDTGEGFAHPLMRWLSGVGEQLDGAVECPTLSLPLDQYEGAMRQLAVCEAKLASLRLSLTRQAELNEVRKLTGAANAAGWVRQQTRMGRREASVSVRLAKALDQTLRATGQALSGGEISLGQAQVIERAIRRLPNDVDAEVRAEAEAFLLDSAQALDVDDLDKAGKHLYEVIAPEDAAPDREATGGTGTPRPGEPDPELRPYPRWCGDGVHASRSAHARRAAGAPGPAGKAPSDWP